ncbi:MAG: Gfo/Idh/MocA family oxidoreductase [Planctomycetes bacterium]|nr:Gfo/Idh/MocA family oxidoreductase [Planctomycetota bacterium]
MERFNARDWTRREILKLAAAPLVVGPAVLGRAGAAAPSERIGLGFIGIGCMGQHHLRRFLAAPEARVLGVCDVDTWRRENAKKTAGEGCDAYIDLRDLLDRTDIDAVVITTGDRWHVPAGVLAAKAGKDIYCEKPMSLTIRQARVMVETVRRHARVFQVGLQQRSTLEFRIACQLVQEGALGKVADVYVTHPGTCGDVTLPAEPVPDGLDWDLWLGPAPWRPYNSRFHIYGRPPHVVPWHFCRDFGGGNLTSNAVHAFDIVQWGLGMDESGPVEIIPPETGKVPSLTYRYANGTQLQVDWKLDKGKHRLPEGWDTSTAIQSFGALFAGEKGWIHVGREGFLQSYPEEIVGRRPIGPEAPRPVEDHHANWLSCIRSRERPACDVAVGAQSTIVSHLGCIAHWTGRALKWDPAKEEFAGDEEANRMRARPQRGPWAV